jgi:hypothetical protein
MGAQPNYRRFTEVFVALAEQYRKLPTEEPLTSLPSWAPAHRLIQSAESLDQYALQHLQEALARSDEKLAPLRDPLALNLGEHRWLSTDREESYSDWLAWVLQGSAGAADILPLFGFNDEATIEKLTALKHKVKREVAGEHGRTDIEVWFGKEGGLLLIEVKTQPPGRDLRSQLGRYERWAGGQRADWKHLVYLGPETPTEDIRPFSSTPWETLCRRLRQHANRLKESDLMCAAAVLIFCGAVEENVLGISASPQRFRAQASFDYLQSWQGGI